MSVLFTLVSQRKRNFSDMQYSQYRAAKLFTKISPPAEEPSSHDAKRGSREHYMSRSRALVAHLHQTDTRCSERFSAQIDDIQ